MAKAKRYELDDAVLGEQKFKGQAALVVKSLLDKHPQTAQEIADDIKSKLQTRQDPLRVVSFYLSTWKKSGLILVAADEAPVTVGTPSEAPVVRDNGEHEDDERDVADLEEQSDAEEETTGEDYAQFDYVNSPLSAAIPVVIQRFEDPPTPRVIADELNVLGRTVTAKQIADASRRLVEKGVLRKVGDGRYSTAV